MALVAEDARDELRMPAARTLHRHIVIELDGQKFDIAHHRRNGLVPGTEIGSIGNGAGMPEQVRRAVHSKSKRGAAIVRNLERPARQPGRKLDHAVLPIGPHQVRLFQRVKSRRADQEGLAMVGVTVKRDAPATQVDEGGFPPVIGMNVAEQDSLNPIPGSADRCQACGELARPQPNIQQDAEPMGFHEAGVASTSTREDSESQSHDKKASS